MRTADATRRRSRLWYVLYAFIALVALGIVIQTIEGITGRDLVTGESVEVAKARRASAARDREEQRTREAEAKATAASEARAKADADVKANAVTYANYQKLTEGMTYQEVVNILGTEGREISRARDGGSTTVEYVWWHASKDGGANCTVTFRGGRLMSKAQAGLDTRR